MFSGRHELKPDEEDGAYFIDRDAELFRYIVNYLRNGEFICPDDRTVRKELLKEAEFFQVKGIIARLEPDIHPSLLNMSVIIKNEHHYSAVMSWLPPGASCSLLYRATTEGKNPADFHRCCDNKGPTLMVIQSGEYICGGYTSKSWKSPSRYTVVRDSHCFLFTLINPSGTEPIKINPKPGASVGIRHGSDLGPRFCEDSLNALAVNAKDTDVGLVGRLDLAYGFTCPQSANKETFFTGTGQFDITEMEMFKIGF